MQNHDNESDVFDFEILRQEYRPEETENLVTNISKDMPIIQLLLAAPSLNDQMSIIQRYPSQSYESLIMIIVVIEFFYHYREKQLDKALALAELNYRLAMILPQQWNPNEGIGLSPARHIADALQTLGSIYSDMGGLSRALDYFLQAEEWYARDDIERSERGVITKSDYDRLFHKRDVRAFLFESMARLYQKLGDETKTMEYGRRVYELDMRYHTIPTQITLLFRGGFANMSIGDFDGALRAFHQALDLAIANPLSKIVFSDIVTACSYIGDTLFRLRLFRQAIRHYLRALELNRRAGYPDRMGYNYQAIGRIFETRPDLGDPLEQYEKALHCASVPAAESALFIWTASDETRLRVIDPDLAWISALAMGRIYIQRRGYDQAEEFLELAIDLGEVMRSKVIQDEYRIGFQATQMDAYETIVKLHIQLTIQALIDNSMTKGHGTQALKYVERARSRAFIDLLSTSYIRPPDEVPTSLLSEERVLLERLRSLSQAHYADSIEQKRRKWDEYEDTRVNLEKVWQNMIAITPASIGYFELRRGQPLEMKALHELLGE